MSDITYVHLVRHGEVYNPSGILYGRAPGFHLSESGLAMANRLGQHFADEPIDALVSSPLERAQETIAPISDRHPDLVVQLDERVIEADNKLAGQVFGARNKAIFNPKNLRYYFNPFKPSWGEPYRQIAERMCQAVREHAARVKPSGHVVIVSHQQPIWVCRLAFEGKKLWHDPRNRVCRVGSITTIALQDGDCVGVGYLEPAKALLGSDANRPFSSGK